MNKQTPVSAAVRAVLMTFGSATLVVLASFAYVGLLGFNAWLTLLIAGKGSAYGSAAVFVSLLGLEGAVVVGAILAVRAYRRALNE